MVPPASGPLGEESGCDGDGCDEEVGGRDGCSAAAAAVAAATVGEEADGTEDSLEDRRSATLGQQEGGSVSSIEALADATGETRDADEGGGDGEEAGG